MTNKRRLAKKQGDENGEGNENRQKEGYKGRENDKQTDHYNPRAKYERTKTKKERVLAALEKTMGVVSSACVMAGIGRTAFYKWCRTDPEFAQAVRDVDERSKDFVESKMYELVNEKNPRIIEFYLSTRCRDRGYGKEAPQENKQVTVNISTEEMSY